MRFVLILIFLLSCTNKDLTTVDPVTTVLQQLIKESKK